MPRTKKTKSPKPLTEKTFKPNEYLQASFDLGVADGDLDDLASYFGSLFDYDTEPIAVLVSLLDRLAKVSSRERKGDYGVMVEDVCQLLSHRLYIKCMDGEAAARQFRKGSQQVAAEVFKKRSMYDRPQSGGAR